MNFFSDSISGTKTSASIVNGVRYVSDETNRETLNVFTGLVPALGAAFPSWLTNQPGYTAVFLGTWLLTDAAIYYKLKKLPSIDITDRYKILAFIMGGAAATCYFTSTTDKKTLALTAVGALAGRIIQRALYFGKTSALVDSRTTVEELF